jgi:uncharacterized membrane protein
MAQNGPVRPVEAAIVAAALLLAVPFRPWAALRVPALRGPWIAAIVTLPILWAAQTTLPVAFAAQLSGACLLVLVFGWPLAIVTLVLVALAAAAFAGEPSRASEFAAWAGVAPATIAFALGMATRRWLPKHVFVYILGRAFMATALSIGLSGTLRVWLSPVPAAAAPMDLVTAHWLVGFGEAFLTGALTAIFVAFRPEWLLTWSDARYLAPPPK